MTDTHDGDLFGSLAAEERAGRPVVLATVVERRGSVPREVGARMLLWADGSTLGSVGGGCAEAEVRKTARDILLRTRMSQLLNVKLTDPAAGGTGDVCGGQMEVFLDYIDAGGADVRR